MQKVGYRIVSAIDKVQKQTLISSCCKMCLDVEAVDIENIDTLNDRILDSNVSFDIEQFWQIFKKLQQKYKTFKEPKFDHCPPFF